MNICIIPARGGSQRIKGKNLKLFHGKPIIEYTIAVAVKSGLFSRIIVSTDSKEIEAVAQRRGVDVYRRSEGLGADSIGTQEVAREVAIDSHGYGADNVCVIYPCSPMINTCDLHYGLQIMLNHNAYYAISVGTTPLQDAGNFYWGKRESFVCGYELFDTESVMIPLPSNRVCDINTMDDWKRAEKMYGELHGIS